MNSEQTLTRVTTGELSSMLRDADFGKRRLKTVGGEEESTPFCLFDSFDGQLARAGAVLIECRSELILLRDSDVPLRQPVSGEPRFAADLEDGPVKTALLEMVSPLRCVLLMGHGEQQNMRLALLDEEYKTQARLDLWTLCTAKQTGQ